MESKGKGINTKVEGDRMNMNLRTVGHSKTSLGFTCDLKDNLTLSRIVLPKLKFSLP